MTAAIATVMVVVEIISAAGTIGFFAQGQKISQQHTAQAQLAVATAAPINIVLELFKMMIMVMPEDGIPIMILTHSPYLIVNTLHHQLL